jgi:hypothetical protein
MGDLAGLVLRRVPPPGRLALQARWDDNAKRLVIINGVPPRVIKDVSAVELREGVSVWGLSNPKAKAYAKSTLCTVGELVKKTMRWPIDEELYEDFTEKKKLGWWVSVDHDHPYYMLLDWDGREVMGELASSILRPSEADVKRYS